MFRLIVALNVAVALAGCAQFPGPETCTFDASLHNTSGPGQTGGARICGTPPDRY